MAGRRIYTPTEYGSNFQGHVKEEKFNPVTPLDESAAIKKRAQDKVENINALAKAAQTQDKVSTVTLQGQQKIAQAEHTANFTTIKGLLSLTKTGLAIASTFNEEKERQDDIKDSLDLVGYDPPPEVKETKKEIYKDDDLQVDSESKGVNEASIEIDDGSIESKSLIHTAQEGTTYNLTKEIKGNVQTAATVHRVYLDQRLKDLPDSEKPRTPADALVLLKRLNGDFFRDTGLYKRELRDEIVETLVPTIKENNRILTSELITAAIKSDIKANKEFAKSSIATFVDQKLPAAELWEKSYKAFLNGNTGYKGDSAALNTEVLTAVLEELSLTGNPGRKAIKDLRSVLKRPGVKGTELEKQYEHLFDKYEKQARTNAVQDYTQTQSLRNAENQRIVDNYYDDPSPKGKQKAIAALKALNTPTSIAVATKLASTGLGYDPHKALELATLQAGGTELDENLLRSLLDNNIISADEYKNLKDSGPLRQSKKELDAILTNKEKVIIQALVQGVPDKQQSSQLQRDAGIRAIAITDDLREAILAELRADESLIGNKKELAATINKHLDKLLELPQYKAVKSPSGNKQWHFPEPINTDTNLLAISVPGKVGVEDYSKFSVEQLFDSDKFGIGEMNPTKDYFIEPDDLKVELKRFKTDGSSSLRLNQIAKKLGYSPKAFLNAQMRLHGLGNINKVQVKGIEGPQTISGLDSGFKYLVTEGGLPWRGSAFLAANIENFRGWSLTEEDKGLLACTPWMDTPARVAALEKKFGKGINEITAKEQISYMMQEMKKDYPEVYRVFMNPNATKGELQNASRVYFHDSGANNEDLNSQIDSLLKGDF